MKFDSAEHTIDRKTKREELRKRLRREKLARREQMMASDSGEIICRQDVIQPDNRSDDINDELEHNQLISSNVSQDQIAITDNNDIVSEPDDSPPYHIHDQIYNEALERARRAIERVERLKADLADAEADVQKLTEEAERLML